MNADEARVVGLIASSADGFCSTCASGLAAKLTVMFPEHDWKGLVMEHGLSDEEVYDALGWERKYSESGFPLGMYPKDEPLAARVEDM